MVSVEEILREPRLIARVIDHTNVKPTATRKDIEKLVEEAKKYGFRSVVTVPYHVPYAKKLVEGTEIMVVAVVGFPWGTQPTEAKVKEVEKLIEFADEFDMVMARNAFYSGDFDYVVQDIEAVVEAAAGKAVKVILETPELTPEQIRKASELAVEAGAHFIKTAVGFKGGATVEAVRIMREVAGNRAKVKASGGIHTFEQAVAMLKAGADVIGASHGVEIVESGIGKKFDTSSWDTID